MQDFYLDTSNVYEWAELDWYHRDFVVSLESVKINFEKTEFGVLYSLIPTHDVIDVVSDRNIQDAIKRNPRHVQQISNAVNTQWDALQAEQSIKRGLEFGLDTYVVVLQPIQACNDITKDNKITVLMSLAIHPVLRTSEQRTLVELAYG